MCDMLNDLFEMRETVLAGKDATLIFPASSDCLFNMSHMSHLSVSHITIENKKNLLFRKEPPLFNPLDSLISYIVQINILFSETGPCAR